MRAELEEVVIDATLKQLGMGKAVVRDMVVGCWSGGIVDGEKRSVWNADAGEIVCAG